MFKGQFYASDSLTFRLTVDGNEVDSMVMVRSSRTEVLMIDGYVRQEDQSGNYSLLMLRFSLNIGKDLPPFRCLLTANHLVEDASVEKKPAGQIISRHSRKY